MRRIAGTVSLVSLLTLAGFGHSMAMGSGAMSGSGGGVSSAATQMLGSFRAVPQMALWREILEAEQREDWYELGGLYDLVLGLTPNSAQVVVQLAHTEALLAARDQPNPETEWAWVEKGLQRMAAARPVAGNPGIIDDGIWTVGFYAGHRFPAKIAAWICKELGSEGKLEEALALDAQIASDRMALRFLADEWLTVKFVEDPEHESDLVPYWETAEFRALPLETRELLQRADKARWESMKAMAERGLRDMRGTGTRLIEEYLRTIDRLRQWATDAERRQMAHDIRAVLEREASRLEQLGDRESAGALRSALQQATGE